MGKELTDQEKRIIRMTILFKKYNKLIGADYQLAPFNEPIMILLRRTGKAEFIDKPSKGKFEYTHTNGEQRYINLNTNLLTFQYGKRNFKGYICHEDIPIPLPANTTKNAEQFYIAIDKTLNDIKLWKAQEHIAMGKMWQMILFGIGAVILAITAYYMLKPTGTP